MEYIGDVYAPPLEGGTRIIQATYGCSHNGCSFCNMYQEDSFRLMDKDFIIKQLEYLRDNWANKIPTTRLYIADGDPFCLSTGKLLDLFDLVKDYLPDVEEFAMYSTVRNILNKSDEDLIKLKEAGLDELYIGYESGHKDFHANLNTGNTVEESYEAGKRLKNLGIKQDMFLMLGTGGKRTFEEAALASASLANEVCPERISVNTMTIREGTDLYDQVMRGYFVPASEYESVMEEKILVENITCDNLRFWGRHPNMAVSVDGLLQEDKDHILWLLNEALEKKDFASFEEKYPRLRDKDYLGRQ